MKPVSSYRNEEDPFEGYHRLFIDAVESDEFPDSLKSQSGLKVLVWAHELTLNGAGPKGGLGSIDLMTVDELGMVWGIEAKTFGNTQLSSTIWPNQMCRYRGGLMRTPWNELHHYAISFLRGGEPMKPECSSLFASCDSIVDVLAKWQERKAKRRLVEPHVLKDRIAYSLKSGSFGLAVVADRAGSSIREMRTAIDNFEHEGRLAYINAIDDDGAGLTMFAEYDRLGYRPSIKSEPPPVKEQTYSEYNRAMRAFYASSIEGLLKSSCKQFRTLWYERLESSLSAIGWSREIIDNGGSSIYLLFRIGEKTVPIVRLAWVSGDRDNRVPAEFLDEGNYAMKVDFYVNQIKDEAFGKKDFIADWVAEFSAIGWFPMGSGRCMRDRVISDSEYVTWNGCIERDVEFFRNDSREQEDVKKFCRILEKYLLAARALVRE